MNSLKESFVFSWLTACWKTYFSHRVRDYLQLKQVSVSDLLLDKAWELWYITVEKESRNNHFWLKERISKLNEQRQNDPRLDIMIDKEIVNLVLKVRWYVVESLTAPFLLRKESWVLKIYIKSSPEIRAKRAMLTSNCFALGKLIELINEKDRTAQEIIRNAWWIDILDEEWIFNSNDVIINSWILDKLNTTNTREEEKEIVFNLVKSISDLHLKKRAWIDIDNEVYTLVKEHNSYSDLIEKIEI